MSFQDIRGKIEIELHGHLHVAAGIPRDKIFFDNVGETPGKSDETYAVISMSFADTVQDTIFCEGVEDLRGSVQVNVYSPRNEGSKPGEDICLEALKAFQAINKWRPLPTDTLAQLCTSWASPWLSPCSVSCHVFLVL